MIAADLTAALLEALAPVADQLAGTGGPGAPARERLAVRPWHVGLACPAAAALDGPSAFDPTPTIVAPSASERVLDLLLLGEPDPNRGGAPQEPHTAFRAAFRRVSDEGDPTAWAWEWAGSATAEQRALLAAAVGRRVGAIARMLTPWPPPDVTHVGRRRPWVHPTRPLALHGGADITLGRRDGTHTIVVALAGDHGPATRRRLAYEALVEAICLRRPPAAVRGLLADAGRDWTVPVDDALLHEGVAAAAAAARTALGITRIDATGLPRDAGPACRYCAHAGACSEGREWLEGPGRLRLGFLRS